MEASFKKKRNRKKKLSLSFGNSCSFLPWQSHRLYTAPKSCLVSHNISNVGVLLICVP